MSLLFSSQVAASPTPQRRGAIPSKSFGVQLREYLRWVFIPKPKLKPVATRADRNRPHGGRS